MLYIFIHNSSATILFKGLRVDENTQIHLTRYIDTHWYYMIERAIPFRLVHTRSIYTRWYSIFNGLVKKKSILLLNLFSFRIHVNFIQREQVSFPVHTGLCFHYCLLLFYTLHCIARFVVLEFNFSMRFGFAYTISYRFISIYFSLV